MPFIHIKSLPLAHKLELASVLEGISQDFAAASQVGLEHVTATWEFFQPGHYAVAGKAAPSQPDRSHPVLVDLLAPDFNSTQQVKVMLQAVAISLSQRAGIALHNIFINHRSARSGAVYDAGEIVYW